ncbi:MAG TPA: hypothetical protein VF677_10110 [Flavobacterium sp.]|jgi:hypothetical protein
MIYKKLLVLACFLITLTSFSQKLINQIPLRLKANRDVFQIVNDSSKEATIFLSDRKVLTALRVNQSMHVMDSIITERPDTKYKDMFGFTRNNSNPAIYWTTKKHDEVYAQYLDFNTKTVTTKIFPFPIDEEKYLESVSINDKLYIIYSVNNSNNLKLHVFDTKGNLETKTISLSQFNILDSNLQTKLLPSIIKLDNDLFEKHILKFKNNILQKIEDKIPSSLVDSSKKNKLYVTSKNIIFTFDNNTSLTQMILIDLDTFEPSYREFKKNNLSLLPGGNSNSFLYKDILYQMELNSEKLFLTIKDLNDQVLKTYEANAKEPIAFKNSEIVQDGGYYSSHRILERTRQYLRKVNNADCGLSLYELNGTLLITMGSVDEISGGGFGMGFGGLVFGGVGAAGGMPIPFSYNPVYNSFNSYKTNKIVSIKCLFDNNFGHVEGKTEPIAFDKIRKYLEDNPDKKCETIFQIDNNYILGYYESDARLYLLRQFQD